MVGRRQQRVESRNQRLGLLHQLNQVGIKRRHASSVATPAPRSAQQLHQDRIEMLGWQSLEATAHKAVQAALQHTHGQGGPHLRIHRGRGGLPGVGQPLVRLLQQRLDPIPALVDAHRQPRMLQRLAKQLPRLRWSTGSKLLKYM